MTQLDIDLEPPKIHPTVGTQPHVLLQAMYRGERLTVLTAIQKYGVYALSQRVGQLKRLGWPIESRTIESDGKFFSEYWIDFNDKEPVPFFGYV